MENKPQLKNMNLIKRKDWLILAAVILLCAAVAVWSFAGIVQTTVTSTGVSLTISGDGNNMKKDNMDVIMDDGAYVVVAIGGDSVEKIEIDNTVAKIVPDWAKGDSDNCISGTVCHVSSQPLSAEEVDALTASKDIGEQIMGENAHNYVVLIRLDREKGKYVFSNGDVFDDFPENTACDVTIILEESHPYEIISGGGQ